MYRLLLLISLSSLFLNADAKLDTYQLYQNKSYDEACQIGESTLKQNSSDEEFVSLYGFSCLNADKLDKLSVAITLLKKSPESRANAAYFSVILMQKKLLIRALSDHYDLKPIKLPTTEYVLSTVFDLYSSDTNTKERRRYNYNDPKDANKMYRLYVTKSGPSPKMVIEEYFNKQMTKRHIYW